MPYDEMQLKDFKPHLVNVCVRALICSTLSTKTMLVSWKKFFRIKSTQKDQTPDSEMIKNNTMEL